MCVCVCVCVCAHMKNSCFINIPGFFFSFVSNIPGFFFDLS